MRVGEEEAAALKAAASAVTYGWGVIPVAPRIGEWSQCMRSQRTWLTELSPRTERAAAQMYGLLAALANRSPRSAPALAPSRSPDRTTRRRSWLG